MMRLCSQILVALSLLATMVSALRVYPHQLAFFNAFAGGPKNGHVHLLHSNLDWGQDFLELQRHLLRSQRLNLNRTVNVRVNAYACRIDAFGLPEAFNIRRITLQEVCELYEAGDNSSGSQGILVLSTAKLFQPELDDVRHLILKRAERVGLSLFVVSNHPTDSPWPLKGIPKT